MKTIEEYVDDSTHAAINALGLSPENVPDLCESLNDWLSEQAPLYITDDEETII